MRSEFLQGLGDFVWMGVTDVCAKYQEVLLGDASISPPGGLPKDERQTVTVTEPDVGGVPLESYGPPPNDAIPGLDIG